LTILSIWYGWNRLVKFVVSKIQGGKTSFKDVFLKMTKYTIQVSENIANEILK